MLIDSTTGKRYNLIKKTRKYAYLQPYVNNPKSLGERFLREDFEKNFTKIDIDNLNKDSRIAIDILTKNKNSYIRNTSTSKNPWNASGLSIQTLIGITKENSKRYSDASDVEVKAIKNNRIISNSEISLLTINPMCFTDKIEFDKTVSTKSVSKYLAIKYGYSHKDFDKNCLSINIYNRYKETSYNYNFRLKIDYTEKRVYIVVREGKRVVSSKDFGYTFDYLFKRLDEKLKNLIIVSYTNKYVDNKEYFKLKQSYLYLDIVHEKFLKLMASSKIFLNMGVSVNKHGKHHDHGSEFRLNIKSLDDIYTKYHKIY